MAANGMVVLFGFFRLLSALSIFFFLSKYIFKPNVILLAGSCNTITRHVTFCTCYIYIYVGPVMEEKSRRKPNSILNKIAKFNLYFYM